MTLLSRSQAPVGEGMIKNALADIHLCSTEEHTRLRRPFPDHVGVR